MTAFERLKAILILVNLAALLFSDWLGGSSDESMLIPGDPRPVCEAHETSGKLRAETWLEKLSGQGMQREKRIFQLGLLFHFVCGRSGQLTV